MQYLSPGLGLVRGPGTGKSDSIPAALSDGELVIPADDVRRFGAAAILSGVKMGGFGLPKPKVRGGIAHAAGGGLMDDSLAQPPVGSVTPPGAVTRVGNSYSGGNVSGPITVNGQAPAGTTSIADPYRVSPPPPQPAGLGAVPSAVAPAPPPGLGARPAVPVTATPLPGSVPGSVPGSLPPGQPNSVDAFAAQLAQRLAPPPPVQPVETDRNAAFFAAANARNDAARQSYGLRPGVQRLGFATGGLAEEDQKQLLNPSALPVIAPADLAAMAQAARGNLAATMPAAQPQFAAAPAPRTTAPNGIITTAAAATLPPVPASALSTTSTTTPSTAPVPPPAAPAVDPLDGGAVFGKYPLQRMFNNTRTQDDAMRRGVQTTAPGGEVLSAPTAPVPIETPAFAGGARRLNATTDPRSTLYAPPAGVPGAATSPAMASPEAGPAAATPWQGSVTDFGGFGATPVDRLAQLNRDLAFQQDKQKWRNPSDPTPGLTVIDGAGQAADARQKFFDEANLRNAQARTITTRRGVVQDPAAEQIAAAIRDRMSQSLAQQRDASDTQRALIGERGTEARARLLDARQQEANAVDRARLGLEDKRLGIEAGKAVLSANKDAIQQTKDTQDIFGILEQASTLLGQATHSTLGTGVDKLAGFFGASTQGAEASAQLKALQGALVAKMPKMSGPQSDKDVQLYREMAGQIGDSTIPREQRVAALGTIRQLNEKYLPAPTDAAGFGSLPSGSTFRAPDGSIRRKP